MKSPENFGRSSLWVRLFLINAFIYVALAFTIPYLNVYYSQMGVTPSQIGILSSIGSFSGLLFQPVWATISDRTGKRKLTYSAVILGCAAVLLVYYLGKTFGFFIFVCFLYSFFNSSVIPLGDALVTGQANKHGFEFSRIRLGGTLFYAPTVLIFGRYLTGHPASMFMFASGAYIVLLLLIRLLPRDVDGKGLKARRAEEKASADPGAGTPPSGRPAKGLLSIYQSRGILLILLFSLIQQIGATFYSSYFGVYIQSLGYTQSSIGVMACISALSEVPVLLLIPRFMKRYGPVPLMAVAGALAALRIFMITPENYALMAVSQGMNGLTTMVCQYCSAVYISRHVVPGNEAKGMSVFSICQTLTGAVLGNILGGILCQNLGYHNAFFAASCILGAVLVIAIALTVRGQKKRQRANG